MIGLPSFASIAHAQGEIVINPGVPGVPADADPTQIVAGFYQFALMLAGLLAFGAIVYGGIKYALATGDPGGQSDARQWITQALWGLLLLVGAVLVLRTINPDLATLSLPGFAEKLPGIRPPLGPGTTVGCVGGQCASLRSLGITCKNGCEAAVVTAEKLRCVVQQRADFVVTEAMPPSSAHSGQSHNNGCAVDIRVNASPSDCAAVQSMISTLEGCGLRVFNEYIQCGGTVTPNRTGDHLHADGC